MSTIVDIQQSDDPRDALHRSVEQLAHGELIALPTETTYIACASVLHPAVVAKLAALHADDRSQRLTLLVKNKEEALDYLPSLSATAHRLLKRCWLGPVTFAFPFDQATQLGNSSLIESFSGDVRDHLLRDEQLWLRAPHSNLMQYVLHLSNAPVVMLELAKPHAESSDSLVITAEEVSAAYPDVFAVIINNGAARYQQSPTVVLIQDDQFSLLQSGIVSEHIIKQLACEMYLFVCTGNTCRSPMAEGMFRKIMSDRLHCDPNALVDRGVIAASAGLAAAIGAAASPETVQIMANRGIDLSDHASQPLTNQLLDQANYIYTMTHQHRRSILAERPELKQRVEVLSRNGSDISDPIGGGMQEYVKCEYEIEQHLQSILKEHNPGQPKP